MAKPNDLLQIQTNVYKKRHRSGATTWVVRWKSPVSGKWKVAAGGRTKAEAMLLEAKVRQELARGNDPSLLRVSPDGSLTVSQVIDQFYKHSRFLGGSAGWRAENKARMEQWIRPALGDAPFTELKKDQILKFYISMRDDGLGRASIHKTHTLLCLVGDCFQELFPESENPARLIRDFGKYFPKRAPEREINFLTPEELETLYRFSIQSRNKLLRPMIRFLAHTGLRRSEALNLLWTDIDRTSGFIHIRTSKNGQARTIPLEDGAWDAIQELQGRGDQVFIQANGERPHEDIFLKPLRFVAKKAGITKRIDLHTFRHSYGSNKIRMGWGLKKVSMLLGHSDISITSDIYTHLLDGDLRVQDDFRFDKAGVSATIGSTALAHVLIAALKKSPEGAKSLAAIESDLKRWIDAGASSELFGEIRNDSTTTSKNEVGAPQMLRERVKIENVRKGTEVETLDQPSLNGEKPNKKGSSGI